VSGDEGLYRIVGGAVIKLQAERRVEAAASETAYAVPVSFVETAGSEARIVEALEALEDVSERSLLGLFRGLVPHGPEESWVVADQLALVLHLGETLRLPSGRTLRAGRAAA
jgi:hypothetical protein